MKKLEDMNLVDDFLMTSLICHQEYGDRSVRYMLECILNRRFGKLTVVPQRVMCGTDPDKHGIRMDVYIDENDGEIIDIEPDQNDSRSDIEAVPRRNRFYHAKIDSANLAAGDDYSNSIEEKTGTDSLKVFHHMVTAVKNDGEVGLAYMKSVEIEKRIREEGREEGHRAGVQLGRVQEIVRLSRRFNRSDEEIIQILTEEAGLDENQARETLLKYS